MHVFCMQVVWCTYICVTLSSLPLSPSSFFPLSPPPLQKLLRQSLLLQERLSQLQVKRDLLGSVFGPETAEGLLSELSANVRRRELLHSQLLQRKSRLQVSPRAHTAQNGP